MRRGGGRAGGLPVSPQSASTLNSHRLASVTPANTRESEESPPTLTPRTKLPDKKYMRNQKGSVSSVPALSDGTVTVTGAAQVSGRWTLKTLCSDFRSNAAYRAKEATAHCVFPGDTVAPSLHPHFTDPLNCARAHFIVSSYIIHFLHALSKNPRCK